MNFRFDDFDFGEFLAQFLCQIGADGIFGLEMTCVDEGDAQVFGIDESVVFAIKFLTGAPA